MAVSLLYVTWLSSEWYGLSGRPSETNNFSSVAMVMTLNPHLLKRVSEKKKDKKDT